MTTENNKLIAEFMGLPTQVFKSGKINYKRNDIWFEAHELSYNVSWDWLMPVIENIDHLQHEPFMSIEKALSTRSIYDTYKTVVEFINEYNN